MVLFLPRRPENCVVPPKELNLTFGMSLIYAYFHIHTDSEWFYYLFMTMKDTFRPDEQKVKEA